MLTKMIHTSGASIDGAGIDRKYDTDKWEGLRFDWMAGTFFSWALGLRCSTVVAVVKSVDAINSYIYILEVYIQYIYYTPTQYVWWRK